MARRKKRNDSDSVNDYRHEEAQRKNNPPAVIAPTYEAREQSANKYSYNPYLDPQLIWSSKKEHTSFDVELVSLHIHERISTRAILNAAKKPQPLQLSIFADPELPLDKAVEFYKHDIDWTNRLVLGDSLLVMNSLVVKESLAGKVQMIYLDPPYGIKYSSNFQPRLDRRDVKDKDDDLTHEPEQIKAYRDTWKLGIHSYLTYLRDRLLLCRELLADSGSIFIQISDENLHLVRCLLDEVFGRENFVAVITYKTTSGAKQQNAPKRVADYLLWYSRNKDKMTFRRLYMAQEIDTNIFNELEQKDGKRRSMTQWEKQHPQQLNNGLRSFTTLPVHSKSPGDRTPREFEGKLWTIPTGSWRYSPEGFKRLVVSNRILKKKTVIRTVTYFDDFPFEEYTLIWNDTSPELSKLYAVQTSTKPIERCILMVTEPGELVFDPTCGSGTTAYCAEKWGRRWITCDTSRVALNIARQRLMTAKFDYYELKNRVQGPAGGFIYQTVPHVTLESIAKNTEIDAIADKFKPQIEEALIALNQVLVKKWKEWDVPHEKDESWPEDAQKVFEKLWSLKKEKRKEIDESIQRNAPQEALYDRPKIKRGIVRISGPFTVEAIPVPMVEDPAQAPIPSFEQDEAMVRVNDKAGDHLTTMLSLLKQSGGVLFPGNRKMQLANLRLLNVGLLHAEAETQQNGQQLKIAIGFGPPHGPITALQTDESIRTARRSGYDILILAGFNIEAAAQAVVQETKIPGLTIHFANVSPDVLVGDLLKTTRASQIFTAFGQPDIALNFQKDNTFTVALRGVDIYDPLTGETHHTRGEDVAAWFLDSDYDGMTFHICQAFFPGGDDSWGKLKRALKAQINPEIFEQMRGTVSFPFPAGKHDRIAVKVIDFRGNEVIRILSMARGENKYAPGS